MIRSIDRWLHSPFFRFVRVAQFVVAVAIFTGLALMPQRHIQTLPASDGYLHFVGNFLLFCSAWVAWHKRTKIAILIVLLVVYSVAIELAQWLTPSRYVDKSDIVANILGLLTGYVFALVAERLWTGLLHQANGTQNRGRE